MAKILKVTTGNGQITFLPVTAKEYVETLAQTKGAKVKTEIITTEEMEALIKSGDLMDPSFVNVPATDVLIAKAEIQSLTEINEAQTEAMNEMHKKIAELEKAAAKKATDSKGEAK